MNKHLLSFFIITVLFMLSGCSSVPLVHHLTPDANQIKQGTYAFEKENYQEAERIFTEVYATTTTKETRNSALYFLACTRIITAENTADFVTAVKALDEWKASYPKLMYSEDPDVLKKALEVVSTNLSNQQEELQKVIAQQKNQINTLKDNVQTLQHQIEELEAIDQQLQEKRHPL